VLEGISPVICVTALEFRRSTELDLKLRKGAHYIVDGAIFFKFILTNTSIRAFGGLDE